MQNRLANWNDFFHFFFFFSQTKINKHLGRKKIYDFTFYFNAIFSISTLVAYRIFALNRSHGTLRFQQLFASFIFILFSLLFKSACRRAEPHLFIYFSYSFEINLWSTNTTFIYNKLKIERKKILFGLDFFFFPFLHLIKLYGFMTPHFHPLIHQIFPSVELTHAICFLWILDSEVSIHNFCFFFIVCIALHCFILIP